MTTKLAYNPVSGQFDLVTATLSPGDITGGTANTFAGFDGSGNLESLPNWSVDVNTTGASFNANLTPADPNADWAVNAFNTTIVPTVDLTQLTFEVLRNYVSLEGPKNHKSTIVLNNGIQTSDTGAHGDIKLINSDVNLGDGTNVSTSGSTYFVNANMHVNASHTATNFAGINLYMQVDGDVTGNVNPLNVQSNLNSSLSSGSGFSGMLLGGNISGAVQFYNGLQIAHNFQSGAAVTSSVQVLSDNTHVYSGATLDSLMSINLAPLTDAGSVISGGYNGLTLNPTLNGSMTGNGANMINGGGQTSATMDFYNAVNMSAQLNSGTTISNGYTGYQDSPHMYSGSSATGITQVAAYAIVDSGVTLTNYQGLQISPQLNSNVSSLSLINLFANGSGTHTNVTGINMDLTAITSTNRRQGININGGTVNFNSTNATTSSLGVDGANFIVPSLLVSPGSPITGTSFISNNFSSIIDIQDNFAVGAIPGVGVAGVGFVGQMSVSTGKTLDAISWALAGSQVAGAGTITDFNLFHALGAIPVGTATITNMYGFRANQFLNGATNVWGISIEEATAENYFEKSLAIGTVSHKVTSAGTGLEIKTKDLVLDGGDQYITAMSANGVITNDTSGKLISVAPGTAGNVLTSAGGAWVSAPAPGGGGSAVIAIANVSAPTYSSTVPISYAPVYDPLATISAGVFTAPSTKIYAVKYSGSSVSRAVTLVLRLNGATVVDTSPSSGGNNNNTSGFMLVSLTAGDTLDVVNLVAPGAELGFADATYNQLAIYSIN